ncbi:MAG: hypothetical protein AAGG81_07725 [Chlamydiota bacterium]
MLKLERDIHTRQVCIRANRGNRLFTKLFLMALFVYILLHAAFFMIFRIDKGQENYPLLILPPVSVHATQEYTDAPEEYSITEYEVNQLLKQSYFAPLPSPITIPPISSMKQKEFVHPEIQADTPPLFSTLETEFLLNELIPVKVFLPMPEIDLRISGELSQAYNEELRGNFLGKVIEVLSNQVEQTRYTFDVIVESKTGRVIWYEKHQDIPQEMEDLLLSLNFEKNPDRFITKGHIEILKTQPMREHD